MGSGESGGPVSSDVQHSASVQSLSDFAREQISARLDRLGKQASLVTQSQDEESIHDFRVAIRRFTQGLLLFPDMLPKRDVTKIRKRLKKLMTLTSEVRNRDIALEHLAESDHESLKSRLRDDRITHARKFAKEINRLVAKDFRSRWRQVLGLEQQ